MRPGRTVRPRVESKSIAVGSSAIGAVSYARTLRPGRDVNIDEETTPWQGTPVRGDREVFAIRIASNRDVSCGRGVNGTTDLCPRSTNLSASRADR